MKAKTLVFRFRSLLLLAIYLLGFFAPWKSLFSTPPSTLWLALSTELAGATRIDLAASTLLVTVVALCCCFAGAVLRLWATAYVGAPVVFDFSMHGDRLVAAGPYRHLRNPLYLGSWLFCVGLSVLMPPSGAFFFWIALLLLYSVLISAEEDFLAAKLGAGWREYCLHVPRLLPRLAVSMPPSGVRARWMQALFAEVYEIGFAICFAVLAWRYDVTLLIKCLIVCFGLSLIARALRPRQQLQ